MSYQSPPTKKSTTGLWIGGPAILLVALIAVVVLLLNRPPAPAAPAAAVIVSAATGTSEPTATPTTVETATPVPTERYTSTPMPELGTSNLFIEYILDASGSMSETLSDGSPKIEVAQRVLTEHMRSFRPETNIGLRVYGHRLPYQQTDESCRDIELIAPPEKGQMERIVTWLQDFTVQGMTPLAASLELAKDDFIYDASRVNSIVMLSDGIETCGGDPCQLVEDLKAEGINFTIHVIGLDVDDPTRQQLTCIAEAGDGTYHDARSQQELNAALGAVKMDVTEGEIVVPSGVNTPTPVPPTLTPQPTPMSVAGVMPGQILYFSNRDFEETDSRPGQSPTFSRHELYAMESDGSNQHRLSYGLQTSNVLDAALSPDRAKLLVGSGNGNIGMRFVDMANPDEFFVIVPSISVISVDWSVDGDRIVYTNFRGPEEELYMMNSDGSEITQLTNDEMRDLYVDWSPEGSMLAYSHDYNLFYMNTDGTDQRQILGGFVRNLDWSPDGRQIAFESGTTLDGGSNPYGDMDIWIVNADGSNPRNLTNSPDVYDGSPSWSPDGRFIVFDSVRPREAGARTQIMKIDVATGEVTQLTTQGNNTIPLWVK